MSDLKTGYLDPKTQQKWNPHNQLPIARRLADECNDPLEKRIIILEGMVADLTSRLMFANDSYAAIQDRVATLECAYNILKGHVLTSTELAEVQSFLEFINKP